LRFFKQIDAAVSRDQDVHVILDNLSAHCTPAIAKWLAHKDRRRWNMHFTPTSSSWLNLIERWFQGTHPQTPAPRSLQQCRRSHRGDHHWAEYWNRDPKPFVWKATADDIIAKVRRGRDTLRQIKSQTGH
jgi:transposase